MLMNNFDDYKKNFEDLLGGFAIFSHFSISFEFFTFHSLTLHHFYALKSYIYIFIYYITFIYISFV